MRAQASASQGVNQANVPLAATLAGGLQATWALDLVSVNRAVSQAARVTALSTNAGFVAPAVAAMARASAAEANSRMTQQTATCELDTKGWVALTALRHLI